MATHTPSKEQRAERHLMRVRGAGKIARNIGSNLFSFTISTDSPERQGQASPANLPSNKRRKVEQPHETASIATAQVLPDTSAAAVPALAIPALVRADAKARARQLAQRLLDDTHSGTTTKRRKPDVTAMVPRQTEETQQEYTPAVLPIGPETTTQGQPLTTNCDVAVAQRLLHECHDQPRDSASKESRKIVLEKDKTALKVVSEKPTISTIPNARDAHHSDLRSELVMSQTTIDMALEPAGHSTEAICQTAHLRTRSKPGKTILGHDHIQKAGKHLEDIQPPVMRPSKRASKRKEAVPLSQSEPLVAKQMPFSRPALASISPNRASARRSSRSTGKTSGVPPRASSPLKEQSKIASTAKAAETTTQPAPKSLPAKAASSHNQLVRKRKRASLAAQPLPRSVQSLHQPDHTQELGISSIGSLTTRPHHQHAEPSHKRKRLSPPSKPVIRSILPSEPPPQHHSELSSQPLSRQSSLEWLSKPIFVKKARIPAPKRSRLLADDCEDVDLDDLITNIATLTKGVTKHLHTSQKGRC